MKIEINKKLLEKETFVVVIGRDVNNMSAKSRDIVLKIKSLEGVKIPNINPLVNYFNYFCVQNNLEGFCADLNKVYGDLKLDFLNKKIPFLGVGKKEVIWCERGEIAFFDKHSVAYRYLEGEMSERVKVKSDTKDVIVFFHTRVGALLPSKHSVQGFARGCKEFFGGTWEVYDSESIEFDYGSKTLDEGIDVSEDLKNLLNSVTGGNKGIKKRRDYSLRFVNKWTLLSELNALLTSFLQDKYPGLKLKNRLILSNSPNFKFGHFSTNITFEIAKLTGEKASEIAEKLCVELRSETRVFSVYNKIEASNDGFINFFVKDIYLLKYVLEKLKNFKEFSSCNLGKNKVILIESPSANPNKAMHLGHLLNVFLAQSLKEIFEKLGFKVYNDNIINDKGLPICKALWALQKYGTDSSPEKEGLKSDHFVDKYYVLGAKEFEQKKEVKKEVRELLLKWENGDKEIIALWKKMIDWVLQGHKETMSRLGEEMGHMWFESEIYKVGKAIIEKHIDGGKIIKTSDGAIVARLQEEYGVSDVVLLKSDGTSLYHTQDLGLTKLKVEKFNPWLAIWVVGNEQIAHFQRLFSLIDSIGLLPIDNLYHLAYGYVFDKYGKRLSSRRGEALSADELLEIIDKKVGNKDIALGALKYAFLSSDAFKDMKFDLEKAVLFTGKSGPYIMYAYARACNILKSFDNGDLDIKMQNVTLTQLNREILLKCLDYPNVIVASANNYSPSILTVYLYELAKLFSQMYETEKVLEAQETEKSARVLIVRFVKDILGDGLKLLRINPLEKM